MRLRCEKARRVDWNVTLKEAVQIQKELAPLLRLVNLPHTVRHVAGADVASSKDSDRVWAGAVVYSYPDLHVLEEAWAEGKSSFPYVPGFLSFREIPVLLDALGKLRSWPDVILCDGQGTGHPRRIGLASHLGFLLDWPTIGCAKSRLIGDCSDLDVRKGSFSFLNHNGQVIGAAARTKAGVKPVFVSPGNRITLYECLEIVFNCSPKYRIPEPIRKAHSLAIRLRKEEGASEAHSLRRLCFRRSSG